MNSYSIRGAVLAAGGPSLPSLGVSAIAACPWCGIPWLRIEVGGRDWRAFTAACPACPPWPLADSVPGSLLSITSTSALGHLPDAVLAHEFQMHLAHVTRSQQHEEAVITYDNPRVEQHGPASYYYSFERRDELHGGMVARY